MPRPVFVVGEQVTFAGQRPEVIAFTEQFLEVGLQRRVFRRAGDSKGHTGGFGRIEDPPRQGLGQAPEQFVEVGDFPSRQIEPFQGPAQTQVQRRAETVLRRIRDGAGVLG
ncbi:hypothetical protein D3C76_1048640 [compost metagenome]